MKIQRRVEEIAKKVTGPALRRGYLAAPYDGIGSIAIVTLSKASSSGIQASVAAGAFGTEQTFPAGTPVMVLEYSGRLEIVSLGSKMGAGTITVEMLPADGLDASTQESPIIAPGTLSGSAIEAGGITSTQIGEGAVSTPHLAANSIEAAHIAAGAVTAEAIDANAVTAEKLESDLILVNNLLRTAESGRRVELDAQGIRNYGTDDELLVNIPTNGDPVSVVGDVVASSFISTNGAELRTTTQFAAGSIATLGSGVANPNSPPSLVSSITYMGLASAPTYPGHGICYDPNGDSGGATPSFWVGGDPTTGTGLDLAYEYNASTGALLRTLRKTGTTVTTTATLGSTSHISDTADATAGSSDSQIGTPLTMPRDGTITHVSAYFAGYGADCSARLAIWNSSGVMLRESATFTAAYKAFNNGNSVRYYKALSSGYDADSGEVIWAGFLRTSSGDGFQWDKDDGTGKTTKKGDGLTGDMTGISTDSDSKPNVYITYTYETDSSVEGTVGKVIGVARQGSYIWILDTLGYLFRYNQSDLTFVDKFYVSPYITGYDANAGLFFDGTNLVICTTDGLTSSDNAQFVRFTTSGVYASTSTDTIYSIDSSTATIRGGYSDGTYYWISVSGSVRCYNKTTGAYVANREFGSSSECASGVTFDTVFRGYSSASNPTKVYIYSTWDWTTESAVYWVGYSWYDSTGTTHETTISPVASITMGRRRRLLVTTPTIPTGAGEDPDRVRVYMARNATEPSAGSYDLQVTDALTARTLTTYNSAGAADPVANDFPAGTAAELKSAVTGWSLKGDGTATFTEVDLASGKLARYVAISPPATPISAATFSASDGSLQTIELTDVPSSGVVAVQVFVMARSDTVGSGNAIYLHNYADTTFPSVDEAIVYATGGTISDGPYWAPLTAVLVTGGTNSRQIRYNRRRSAGTVTWHLRVLGYWTTE